ncbi:MAG: oligosaccharide flippase family protein [Rhodobacteraceae bacterium]|nr:oligosaccharide flippase family protein [Paracoccaceae bacterium]
MAIEESTLPVRQRGWLRNVATSYGDIAVGGLVYILLTPFVIHHLGLEAYAIWVVSHTITFYLGLFDLGFSQAHVRFHARHAARRRLALMRRLAATVFLALACAGAVAMLLALGLVLMPIEHWFQVSAGMQADFRLVVLVLGVNLLFALPGSTLENIYEGEQRFDIRNLRSIVLRVLTVALQVGLLVNGYGIVALALVELAVTLLRIAIDLVVTARLVPGLLRTRLRFDRATWRRIRPFALWAFVDDLLVEGTAHIDKLLVALLLPLALLTPYALCVAVAGLLMLAAQPMTETFFPMASAFHARGRRADMVRLLLSGTKISLVVSAPLLILLLFHGEGLMLIWVPELEGYLPPGLLQLILLNFYLSVGFWTATLILMAANRIRFVALLTITELLLALVLILLLVPWLGLNGLALGALVANALIGMFWLLPTACRHCGTSMAAFAASAVGRPLLISIPVLAVVGTLQLVFTGGDWALLTGSSVLIGLLYVPGLLLFGLDGWERASLYAWLRRLRHPGSPRLSEAGKT